MSTGHNFRYIQFRTPTGVGFACVSIEWTKVDSRIDYTAGVSFCSPKDIFDKRRAREMANNRRIGKRLHSKNMNYSGSVAVIDETKFISNSEFDRIFRNFMSNAPASGTRIPNWASKALHLDAYTLGLTQEQGNAQPRKLSQLLATQVRLPATVENGRVKVSI